MRSMIKLNAICLAIAFYLANDGSAVHAASPAVKEPVPDKLTASVKATKAQFATDERLQFVVTFVNGTAKDVTLDVTEYLGSQTAGKYTPQIHNVATGAKWQFQLQQSRWKPHQRQEIIKPGASLNLTYAMPGTFLPADNAAAVKPSLFLPAGNYELTLTIEASGAVLTPAPVTHAGRRAASRPVATAGFQAYLRRRSCRD